MTPPDFSTVIGVIDSLVADMMKNLNVQHPQSPGTGRPLSLPRAHTFSLGQKYTMADPDVARARTA
jgi:hypothetical protein